ncbi:AAA family ATPase [candidate division KSB1 bacterium]|nr:AAA family ATPase [candidate division KSB1 bacterium]
MYLKHFKIAEEPFSTTPDPRFLYRSEIHEEALDRIITSVSLRRGINAIIGEPGLGKSMLIRTMLKGLQDTVRFAWVFNTTLNSRELLKYICRDFGFKPKNDDMSDMLLELYTFLIKEYENGKLCLLIVDEAQNLKPNVLEEIRQLSNLETVRKKLLQVILSGQPQLDVTLEHPDLNQLKQRISLKAILHRLNLIDTKKYIQHRLDIAGNATKNLFTEAAMNVVYEISGGIPRLINQVCDNALLVGAKRKINQIDSVLVTELLEKGLVTPAGKPYIPLKKEDVIQTMPQDWHPGNKKNGNSGSQAENMDKFDGLDLASLTTN